MRRRRITLCLAMILAVSAVGCTGVPDRSHEVAELKQAMSTMPGVGDADFSHENALGRGATVYATIWMPEANHQQIVDVVNRFNDVRGDRLDGYNQSITFQTTDDRRFSVRCGADLDAGVVADQGIALRSLSKRITVASADASCGPGERGMTLRDNKSPVPQVLEALKSADAGLASIEILSGDKPTGMDPFSSIDIRFPFSAQDWSRFQGLVSRMDGTPWLAGVGPGPAVSGLGVRVRTPATAYEQLSAVIKDFDAGPPRPMLLSWALENPTPRDAMQFQGSVDVGGCEYGTPTMGDENPEKYYTPEAIELQKRMRKQYDTCPR